ncbi:MAG: hypothetical protein WA019_05170 [Candidatus Moraniibacteriota bacterium]
MKVVQQQIEHGQYLLTIEESRTGKKSFTIQNAKDGTIVIGNTYQDEVNIPELIECISRVINFFNQDDKR